jgi:hypothetical protein
VYYRSARIKSIERTRLCVAAGLAKTGAGTNCASAFRGALIQSRRHAAGFSRVALIFRVLASETQARSQFATHTLSPRSHAGDPNLAAKPAQENGDYGYVVMNKTVVGCRSNCGGQAWPGQATLAVLPRVSSRTFSRGLLLSADAVIAHRKSSDLSPQSRRLTASDPFTSSHEIEPAINTHRPRAG